MKRIRRQYIKVLFFIGTLLWNPYGIAQTTPQCLENDAFLRNNRCYYCANGTESVKIEIKINDSSYSFLPFKCTGVPNLGKKCSSLHTHHYDKKTHLCSFCPVGYIFDFHRTNCYRQ